MTVSAAGSISLAVRRARPRHTSGLHAILLPLVGVPCATSIDRFVADARRLRRWGQHELAVFVFGGGGREAWGHLVAHLPRGELVLAVRQVVHDLEADGVAWTPNEVLVPGIASTHRYVQIERLGAGPVVVATPLETPDAWTVTEGTLGGVRMLPAGSGAAR